ncbi:MAG: GtrA family protein [Saprospiraceae bacterium]|nr:GtrA family protein [Saprospiraceae bacterium]MCF8251263.1 GtrA family protein [Saprospiraceae bacterium]MCF8280846.1 GtrA family protein [Bacteroidales bacterium]MCF8311800.1 GtrA family protein [Saprospiraceae bacterium]MCF8441941.1 GtrA family protein [Saprospiraceae bacterium]
MKSAAKSPWMRSQVAAVLATGTDFLVTIGLKELAGLWYVASNATGAFCGAVVSFLLLRNWAFKRHDQQWHGQAVRYVLASGLSLLMNTGGVWFLTETFDIQYIVSKTIVAIVMGLTVNYLMFKHFVFAPDP